MLRRLKLVLAANKLEQALQVSARNQVTARSTKATNAIRQATSSTAQMTPATTKCLKLKPSGGFK